MSRDQDAPQNNLADRLRARIQREGPINFHEWMQAALYDERDGYYCRADLIRQGRAGDYRTAPETSALFAATFANYFTKLYFDLGQPPRWSIIEAGAGSGEFAYGVLKTLKSGFPAIFEATHYLFAEASYDSQNQALAKLAPFADRVDFRRLGEINEPIDHVIIFSNELLDALPVHRLVGRKHGLRELYVGWGGSGFVWLEGDPEPDVAEYCTRLRLELAEGQVYEVNLEADRLVARAAQIIRRGFLVSVDYGAPRSHLLNAPHRFRGTLRGFRRHQMVDDVLADPGCQDLTTTVDWTQIEEAGTRGGMETLRLERLDQFLLHEDLLETLLAATSRMTDSAGVVSLQTGAREMIRPDGLAASFQVLIQRKDR